MAVITTTYQNTADFQSALTASDDAGANVDNATYWADFSLGDFVFATLSIDGTSTSTHATGSLSTGGDFEVFGSNFFGNTKTVTHLVYYDNSPNATLELFGTFTTSGPNPLLITGVGGNISKVVYSNATMSFTLEGSISAFNLFNDIPTFKITSFDIDIWPLDVHASFDGNVSVLNDVFSGTVTSAYLEVNNEYIDAAGLINFAFSKIDNLDIRPNAAAEILAAALPGNDTIYGNGVDEYLDGQGGNDLLLANVGVSNDTLIGGTGNDTLTGDDGNDLLDGGDGNDWLDAIPLELLLGSETLGNDTLKGGGGNDILFDPLGNNIVDAGSGDDFIFAFAIDGGTVATGGLGKDQFFVSVPGLTGISTYYEVTDFQTGAGGDVINLAIPLTFLLLDGYFQDGDPFDPALGFMRYEQSGSDILVRVDDDGLAGGTYPWFTLLTIKNQLVSNLTADNEDGFFIAGVGNDSVGGDSSDEFMFGGSGNDTLNGGGGKDSMFGGVGEDVFYVDNALDRVEESSNEPPSSALVLDPVTGTPVGVAYEGAVGGITDTVLAAVNYVLSNPFVENLTLTGAVALSATGNDGHNVLTGNALNNTLTGGLGNDTLIGAAGRDTLNGGADDDVYVIDSALDLLQEAGGFDIIHTPFTGATLAADFEGLTLLGTAIAGTGNTANNVLTGNASNNVLSGLAGTDTLIGNAGIDTLNGGADADILRGGDGNDVILIGAVSEYDAGEGDTIDGGTGVDVLRFASTNGAETLTLTANIAGLEAVAIAGPGGAATTTALDVNADGVTDKALAILGNNGVNTLIGTGFNDTIAGNGGNDSLSGGAGTDRLDGGADTDTLDGGAGNDTMQGGAGNDTFFAVAAGDVIADSAGIDTVITSSNYTLGTGIENLTFTGATGLLGTGNTVNNAITGTVGDDTLAGGAGIDTLSGGAGDDWFLIAAVAELPLGERIDGGADSDTLRYMGAPAGLLTLGANVDGIELVEIAHATAAVNIAATAVENALTINGNDGANALIGTGFGDSISGAGGNDTITGGAGADYLQGGEGNDVFLIAGLAEHGPAETILGDNGNDAIRYTGLAGQLDLSSNVAVESVVIASTAAVNVSAVALESGIAIIGNAAANVLRGSAYADSLAGAAGNDSLVGAAGDDTLDGGAGNDTMAGGEGDDIYFVDATGDVVDETGASSGDTVVTTSNFTMVGGSAIENVTLAGTATTAVGNDGINTITGNPGNNSLSGDGSDDVLVGLGGNDTLNGGNGDDTLEGGPGNDVYILDSIADVFIENTVGAPGGVDLVRSEEDVDLTGTQIENAILTGAGDEITGNELANQLTGGASGDTLLGALGIDALIGNAGNDWLDGGGGKDVLNGGLGDDTYVVDGTNTTTYDTVTEATGAGTDTVHFAGSGTYILPVNTDHLVLLDVAGNANGTGNTAANQITGNASNNVLSGLTGNDTYFASAGNDTYVITEAGDTIDASGGDADVDTVLVALAASDFLDLSDKLWLEKAVFTGTGVAILTGNELGNALAGNAGNDVISGDIGADSLAGNGGNDSLVGGDDNDTLNGGVGNDTMIGGTGDDTYVIDATGDQITEAGGDTDDKVFINRTVDLNAAPFTEIEHAELTGTTAANATGDAGANRLTGNDAVNVFDGGAGDDTIRGGGGNDIFLIGSEFEHGASEVIDGGAGVDTIRFTSMTNGDTLALASVTGVEVVQLSTAAGVITGTILDVDASSVATALSIIGNDGINAITGGAGNDTISGNGGDDLLGGGAGVDRLLGGAGDDILIWDAADTVAGGLQGGIGTDTLQVDGTGITLDLTGILDTRIVGVEKVELSGGGNTLVVAGADVLAISTTSDTLTVEGGAGDTVNAIGAWVHGGMDVNGYHHYTLGTATLLVSDDITNLPAM